MLSPAKNQMCVCMLIATRILSVRSRIRTNKGNWYGYSRTSRRVESHSISVLGSHLQRAFIRGNIPRSVMVTICGRISTSALG